MIGVNSGCAFSFVRDLAEEVQYAAVPAEGSQFRSRELFPRAVAAAVRIRIGDVEREAIASDGSFAVEPGQLAFAPGSSGWARPGGGEVRFVELFLRGGNAWEAFGRPAVGTPVMVFHNHGG